MLGAPSRQSWWIFGNALPYTSALLKSWPKEAPILMVESRERAGLYRYHKQKLVLLYSAMRHCAAWLEEQGYCVDYHRLEETATFEEGWRRHCERYAPQQLHLLRPTDYGWEHWLAPYLEGSGCSLVEHPNDLFLTDPVEFCATHKGKKHLLMESHYRAMRRAHGVLLDAQGDPEGGRWNYDASNRKGFKKGLTGQQAAPITDPVVEEVQSLVEHYFPEHPGALTPFYWPVTRAGALQRLRTFISEQLPLFGPHQDTMVRGEPFLHHSLLSSSLNIGLLHPMECIRAAEKAYRSGKAPLESVEGFIRQILGWREFIWGIYWLGMPELEGCNALEAQAPLPPGLYSGNTGMCCVDTVVAETLQHGYAHHIQRLMVISNLCTLLGVEPRQVLRWFMELFIDAYPWVMVPNVFGMGLFADGGFFATKPYVSAGAYIRRMSNYCDGCRYNVKERLGPDACPFNALYWDFLLQHEERWRRNPRMARSLIGLKRLDAQEREQIHRQAQGWKKLFSDAPPSHPAEH